MADHTPGPWRMWTPNVDSEGYIFGADGNYKAAGYAVAEAIGFRHSVAEERPREETEANARLIAEAPAMYEALRTAVEAIRLTREYVGEALLPPMPGWAWHDATEAINDLLDRIDGAAVEA